jgi:hypothetical protein
VPLRSGLKVSTVATSIDGRNSPLNRPHGGGCLSRPWPSNYVIGSLRRYKRFFSIGGVEGDKERGIQQMRQAAEHKHYLKPFAEILLALAYESELNSIRRVCCWQRWPDSSRKHPLFARELSLLQRNHSGDQWNVSQPLPV